MRREDTRAAAVLLDRSLELTRPQRLDVHLEADLVRMLIFADTQRALTIAEAAERRAQALGDEAGAALARSLLGEMRMWAGESSADEVEQLCREAVPVLEAAGDDEGLMHVWLALGQVANMRCQYGDWAKATEQAILYARAVGPDDRTWGLGTALAGGPRPAAEALEAFDAALGRQANPFELILRGVLLAMLDRIEEAWAVALPAEERARELGWPVGGSQLAEIAILAGDDPLAAEYLRRACDGFEASGNSSVLSTYAPLLGRVLCALGSYDEAEPLVAKGRELGDPTDVLTQTLWRQTDALLHSHRREHSEAEQLARESVEWAERSDTPVNQGDALSVLAEVLEAVGRREEAIATWHEALALYERKGITPFARRTRKRIAALQETPT
jgi:tetratricopeptide (TPR) repeat protein